MTGQKGRLSRTIGSTRNDQTSENVPCALLLNMAVWGGTGAGWGYLILNLFLVLAVADAMVGALAAMFTMCSNNWRTAGQSSLTGHTPALLFAARHGPAWICISCSHSLLRQLAMPVCFIVYLTSCVLM